MLHRGVLALEKTPDPRDGSARADARHEMGDPPGGLLPQLGAGRRRVRGRIGRVVILVGLKGARDGLGQTPGHGVVGLGVLGRHRRRADDHLGAEGPQQLDLLGGDLVGHGEHAAVAPAGGHHRQAHARVAGRRLDDRAAGLQPAVRLRRLDHGDGRAVLHAAARVEVLELGQEMAGQVPTDAVHAHQRGVAEQIDERVGGLHGPAPIADRADADAGLDAARRHRCRGSPAGRHGGVGRPPWSPARSGRRRRRPAGCRPAGRPRHRGGRRGPRWPPRGGHRRPGGAGRSRRPPSRGHPRLGAYCDPGLSRPARWPGSGRGGASGVPDGGLALDPALLGSDAVVLPANGWSGSSAHAQRG